MADSYYTVITPDFTTQVDQQTNQITYTDNVHPLVAQVLAQVLAWGRNSNQAHIVDRDGHFDRDQTEQLRRLLRGEFTRNNYNVCGSWRQGYEMTIGNERVGVTNGHGSQFRVYYRRIDKGDK